LGCALLAVGLFVVPVIIAGFTGGEGEAYWIPVIAAVVILVAVGVGLEKKIIRRR
jgi:hypothetical protein